MAVGGLALLFAAISALQRDAWAADITPPSNVTDLFVSSGVAAGELVLSWSAPSDDSHGGSLVDGFYRLDYSTDPAHLFAAGAYQVQIPTSTSPGRRETAWRTGLLGNASYYARVFSGDDVPNFSGPSNAAVGVTRAYPPSAPGHGGASVGAVQWTWGHGSNQSDTRYYAQDETAVRDWAAGTSWTGDGPKTPNTRYTLLVKGRDRSGLETAYASTSAWTAIEVPTGMIFDLIGVTSVTARAFGTFTNLTAGLSGVRHVNETTGADSGWTQGISWTFTGLSSNTLYSFAARSRNAAGEEAGGTSAPTATRLSSPAVEDISIAADGSVIAVSVPVPPNPYQINTGSEFLYVEGSGGYGSGKLVGAYTHTVSGLAPNTCHSFRVRYYDTLNRPTDLSPVVRRCTLAVQPAFADYGGAGEDRLMLNWGTPGNPAGTEYVAEVSGDAFSSVSASSRTRNAYAVFQGLEGGRAYASRVRALNGDEVPTPWTDLGMIPLVSAPAAPRHESHTVASIQWGWQPGFANPPDTPYYAEDESGASGWQTGAVSWTSGGKSPNTRYTLRVRGRTSREVETAAVSTSAYTSIEPAAGLALDSVGLTSITARALGSFSNLESGLSGVRIADDAQGASSGWVRSANWSYEGLSPNTLCSFTARVRNGDGEETPPTAPLTAATRLPDPGGSDLSLAADSQTQLTLTVTPPANPLLGATGSEFVKTEGLAGGAGSGRITGAYTYVVGGLSPNARYAYKVRFFNAVGLPTEFSPPKARHTLAAQPAVLPYGGDGEDRLRLNWGSSGNAAGTEYAVEVSSDGFVSVTASSRTFNAFASFQGLAAGGSYRARVKAINGDGVETGWTQLGDVVLATPPRAPAHASGTLSSLDWVWAAGEGNPAGTEYFAEDGSGDSGWAADAGSWTSGGKLPNSLHTLRVKARNALGAETAAVSTSAYTSIETPSGIGFDMVGVTSVTARALGALSNLSSGISGVRLSNETAGGDSGWMRDAAWTSASLSPNTVYSFAARARNGDGDETGAAAAAAVTGLAAPGDLDLTLTVLSSAAVGLSLTPPPNPSLGGTGSEFLAVEGAGAADSGVLPGVYSFTAEGLHPNTRYGYKARYRNAANSPSGSSPVLYRWTFAERPGPLPYTDVWDRELGANWSASGNSEGTEYAAELSTDSFVTVAASSRTINVHAVFTGLAPDTGYRIRVKAVNGEGFETAWADLGPVRTLSATPGEPTHLGQDGTSIVWIWPKGDNPAGTEYRAWDETGDTGWVADNTRWTSAGKSTNTAYTLSVKSRNAFGVETPVVSTSAYTSVQLPAGIVFPSVWSSSLTVRVLPGFSNLETGRSGVRVFDETRGVDSGWIRDDEWAFTELAPNRAYSFSAVARNGDGEETVRTEVRSTWTLLEAPSPADWTLSADSSDHMTLALAPPPNPAAAATGCEFESLEGAGGTGSGPLQGAYAWLDGGLSLNTRYSYRVRYFNGGGAHSAWSAPKTLYTLAAAPGSRTFDMLGETALRARWLENGNLPGTRYRVELSTDGYSSLVAAVVTSDVSVLFSGLTPNTTFSARVSALNEEDALTAFTGLGALATLARLPEGPSIVEAGGRHLKAAWGSAGNLPGTLFELQLSKSQDFSSVSASSVSADSWALIDGLEPSTTYYARVRANGWGAATAFVLAGSSPTLSDALSPSAVSDLSAAPGESEGTILLSWTAPGDDGSSGTAASYVVRWSPSPIASLAEFDSAAGYAQAWTPRPAGEREERLLTGLVPGATYYLSIAAVDESRNRGLPAEGTPRAWAQWDRFPPSAAGDLAAGSVFSDRIEVRWTAPGDDGGAGRASEYDLRYSPLGPIDTTAKFLAASRAAVPAPAPAGSAEAFVLGGLSEGTTYWFALRTSDERPNWAALSPVRWAATGNSAPPAAPVWAPEAWAYSDEGLVLDWLENPENDLAGYRLLRAATAGGPYSEAAVVGADRSRFVDSSALPGATWYYVVAAFDHAGLESPLSSELQAFREDLVSPEAPAGLRAYLLDDGRYRLEWGAVVACADLSPLADLAGYRVYRAVQPGGPAALAASLSSMTFSWTEAAAGGPAYFTVRAVDARGNESLDSLSSAPDLSVRAASADGTASLSLGRSAAAVLYRDGNAYGEDLRLSVERVPSQESGRVLRAYSVSVRTAGTRAPAEGAFASLRARPELSFKVPGYGPSTSARAAAAAVFWFDGADWVKLGGDLDPATGLLTVRTTRTGAFQVRQSLRSESLSLMQVVPQKIFTPNGDGVNDSIEFFFDNPSDTVVSGAKVYDLTGAEVSDMRRGTAGTSYLWDGRDSSGRTVSGGVYIYQFQAEGKTINGTVVVAK